MKKATMIIITALIILVLGLTKDNHNLRTQAVVIQEQADHQVYELENMIYEFTGLNDYNDLYNENGTLKTDTLDNYLSMIIKYNSLDYNTGG